MISSDEGEGTELIDTQGLARLADQGLVGVKAEPKEEMEAG